MTQADSARQSLIAIAVEEYFRAREQGELFDRDAFLQKYPDVADELASFLDGDRLLGSMGRSSTHRNSNHHRAGEIIGRYTLVKRIGAGGMGEVWVAQQSEPVKREVALKLIKRGMDSESVLARFELERQALALMDHPNIAKVHDAGVADDGRPYFVMEYVVGESITEYCDRARLTVEERLQLFVPVCHAIQHAHQKGIIHRDVKPSNVIVASYDGKPVPKVIDFGVAKAIERLTSNERLSTQFGALVGTIEYMSPEQAGRSPEGIDTRSDVYSLGVLLYELLTGATPLGRDRLASAGIDEILRFIKEVDPPAPSTKLSNSGESLPSISAVRRTEPKKLTKLVRGELDWIVMKCLEKKRDRRYSSANELAADVICYLADDPISAAGPSKIRRLSRLLRRHRFAFMTAGFAVFVLLVGTAVSLSYAYEAVDAKKAALEAQKQSEKDLETANKARRELAVKNEELTRRALLDHLQAADLLINAGQPSQASHRLKKASLFKDQPRNAEMARLALERRLGAQGRLVLPAGGFVMGAAYSPNGEEIAALTADGLLRRWEFATGRLFEECRLPGRFDMCVKIAYSSNGAFIACGGARTFREGGHVVIVEIRPAIIQRWTPIDPRKLRDLRFEASFNEVAAQCHGEACEAFEARTGERIALTAIEAVRRRGGEGIHLDGAQSGAFGTDPRNRVSAESSGHEVKFRSKATGQVFAAVPVLYDRIPNSCSFTRDGRTLLVSTDVGHVQELPVVLPPSFAEKLIVAPRQSEKPIWAVVGHFRVHLEDGRLIFADEPSGRSRGWLLAPSAPITRLVAGENSRTLRIITEKEEYTCDLSWLSGSRVLVSLEGSMSAMSLHRERSDMLTLAGSDVHAWRLYDTNHGISVERESPVAFMTPIDDQGAIVTGTGWSPRRRIGSKLVSKIDDKGAEVFHSEVLWDRPFKPLVIARAETQIRDFEIDDGEVLAVGHDKMGSQLIALTFDNVIAFDIVTGKERWRSGKDADSIWTLDISPDGRFAAFGDRKAGIRVIGLDHGRSINLPAPSGRITEGGAGAVRFSIDGSRLYASLRGTIHVYDATTWKVESLRTIFHQAGTIAISPRGDLLACGGYGCSAQLYALPGLKFHGELLTKGSGALAFSPDGSALAVGDREGRTTLWDPQTMDRLTSVCDDKPAPVSGLAFIEGGRSLLIHYSHYARPNKGLVRWRLAQ